MNKKVIALALCAIFLSVSANAFADNVFKTKNGKKYHTADCPLIQSKNPQEVSLKEATEKGLKPCSKCFKDGAALKKERASKQIASGKKVKKSVTE